MTRANDSSRLRGGLPLAMGAAATAGFTLLCLTLWSHPARAVELWSSPSGDRYCSLDTSLKWTSTLSRAPSDTVLYPEEWSAVSLWRFRAVLSARPGRVLAAQLAYEQRARLLSGGAGVAGAWGGLPSTAEAPYRVRQLDASLVEVDGSLSVRHELDRAFLAASFGRVDLVVGRQAIGWGRGVYFSAVDVFVPFSPLESDREWRRGIDAARLVVPIGDNASLDAAAAFGESREESAFMGRLRGYIGDVDGELIVGRRCEDDVYGASASLPVGDAELHGEVALFDTPDEFTSDLFGTGALAMKAVAGGSYNFDWGDGFYVMAEYHYSGFGFRDVARVSDASELENVLERYVRGDTQVLGRHATAVQVIWGAGAAIPLGILWIASPADGSGIVIPFATWSFSDSVTLAASAYVPHGSGSEAGIPGSEYGAAPVSGLLQMSFYY